MSENDKRDLKIVAAICGMVPGEALKNRIMKKLKVYAGDSHPHTAQQPKVLEL